MTDAYEYRGLVAEAWDLLRGDTSAWPDRACVNYPQASDQKHIARFRKAELDGRARRTVLTFRSPEMDIKQTLAGTT